MPRHGVRPSRAPKKVDPAQEFRRVVRARLPEVLAGIGFGDYKQAKLTGLSRTAFRAYSRGKGGAIPRLDRAALLTRAAGEMSLDWCVGRDVPESWRVRAEVGDLEGKLRDVLVNHLADCLELSPEFVAALLPPQDKLLEAILAWGEAKYGKHIEERGEWQRDQVFARASLGGAPDFGKVLEEEKVKRERAKRDRERRAAVRGLPDPTFPTHRTSSTQLAKRTAYLRRARGLLASGTNENDE